MIKILIDREPSGEALAAGRDVIQGYLPEGRVAKPVASQYAIAEEVWEAMIAQTAIYEEKDDWQPIDTAPIDGTAILVCCEDEFLQRSYVKHMFVAFWRIDNPVTKGHWALPEGGVVPIPPKWWQHLPQPPRTRPSLNALAAAAKFAAVQPKQPNGGASER
jgi:hypothetical protein